MNGYFHALFLPQPSSYRIISTLQFSLSYYSYTETCFIRIIHRPDETLFSGLFLLVDQQIPRYYCDQQEFRIYPTNATKMCSNISIQIWNVTGLKQTKHAKMHLFSDYMCFSVHTMLTLNCQNRPHTMDAIKARAPRPYLHTILHFLRSCLFTDPLPLPRI